MPLLTEAQKDYIYHGEWMLGDQRIIMSDHVDITFTTCYSNFLTVIYDTQEEVERVYEMMKEAPPFMLCRPHHTVLAGWYLWIGLVSVGGL